MTWFDVGLHVSRERHSFGKAATTLAVGVGLLCSASACSRSSKWTNMAIDATFTVNGKVQHASTTWRTRIQDTIPSGSVETTQGDALVLPVGPGHYIFGTFVEYSMGEAFEGSIATVIDNYVLAEHRRRHNGPVPSTRAAERDNAVAEAKGMRVPICEHEPAKRIQPPCLLFVTFADPNDFQSAKRVDVGTHVNVAGQDVVISAVTIGFVDSPRPASSPFPDLAWLRSPSKSLVTQLPAGPGMLFKHPIVVSDFRRP